MLDALVLTQRLLADKIELPQIINCTEIIRTHDISVISAEVTSCGGVVYQATAIWDLRSDGSAPLHLHISQLSSSISSPRYISLRSIDGRRYEISAEEIAFAHSSGRYMTIATANGQKIVSVMTFLALSELTDGLLCRTNRSYAVNPHFVAEVLSGTVILKNSIAIPLSRSFAPAVRDEIRRLRYGDGHIFPSQPV